jgi:3-oxoacyl-[acyl-carrier protein] reductase
VGRLEGRSALITGGGRGIGAATALRFAREGARVGIMGKGQKTLDVTKRRIADAGFEIATFAGDVGRKEDATAAVEAFVKQFGGIDILVNNAGINMGKPFFEKSADEWAETMRVNVTGTFLMCQAAAKHMTAAKKGTIVNIASVRGVTHLGREGVMDYSASKAAVINMTATLAKQLAPDITVNAVAPGHTETDMFLSLAPEIKTNMMAGTYLKRAAKPEEIAGVILFLASKDAACITGQTIVADCGFSLKAG